MDDIIKAPNGQDNITSEQKERQSEAVELARQADVVIVVGGRSSNNTRELVKTCARYCARVHHAQIDADVRPEWFDAAKVVGLASLLTASPALHRAPFSVRPRQARGRWR